MRTLTATERAYLQNPAGFRCYAYVRVTNPDGTWINLGALTTSQSTLDFVNTATISDSIDSNTISFSATMEREIGDDSLVPMHTASEVNVDDAGAYAPLIDLARLWDVWCAIVPHGVVPSMSDYRQMAQGYITRLEITDVVTITGMGMEWPILNAYVTADRTYSEDLEDVIQEALADEFGTDVIPLTFTPTAFNVDVKIGSTNLFPVLADSAGLKGDILRYRYDASNVLSLTLFTPQRDAAVADWEIGGDEYERLDITADISGVRNFVVIDYPDASFGDSTVVSPAAETGTLACVAGAGTFSVSQAGVIAVGAKIVVARGTGDYVAYTVATFNGTTGCTLAGTPTFSAREWHTSASITKYGLLIYALDLTLAAQITTQAAVGDLADLIRSDLENPALEQSFTAPGLWFVDLHDYVTTLANGVHYIEDQSGGVTSYTHDFSGGMLTTTVGLSGKPKGRYALWRKIGTDTPRTAFTPVITNLAATFGEATLGPIRVPYVTWTANVNDRTRSVFAELSTTDDFAVVLQTQYADVTDGIAPGVFTGVTRDSIYYVRATPYSGPLSAGVSTGVAGPSVIDSTFVQFEVPTQAALDTITETIIEGLGAGANIGSLVVFVPTMQGTTPGTPAWAAFSTIPTSEVEVGTEYRRQHLVTGAISARIIANVKAVTGTPTMKAKYTVDNFGAVADLVTYVPPGTGLRVSNWSTLATGARADIGLTAYLADGADTAALDLYYWAVEFGPATVSGARIHTDAFAPAFN